MVVLDVDLAVGLRIAAVEPNGQGDGKEREPDSMMNPLNRSNQPMIMMVMMMMIRTSLDCVLILILTTRRKKMLLKL